MRRMGAKTDDSGVAGRMMSRIFVGTSGYSYADWRGTFYPEDLPQKEMLSYYAKIFNCVELNFTYYRIPPPTTIQGIVDNTPPDFQLTIKANQATTHELDASVITEFRAGIEPAAEAGKLAGILCQFPFSFKNTQPNRAYLARLAKDLRDYAVIVEFRNDSWITDAMFDFLRANGLAYCSVDEPALRGLVPPVARVTSRVGYLRFHSRDASKWYGGDKERYDYLYTREEMGEWLPRVQQMDEEAEKMYIFFNNCHAGSAAVNAAEFRQMLAELGLLGE